LAGEGEDLPERVEAEPPLVAKFLGGERRPILAGGVTSAFRDVEISLPPSANAEVRHGTIHFHWASGRTRSHRVFWEVVPPLRSNPKTLVLKESERNVPNRIVVSSDDRPFRVTSIGPASLIVGSEVSGDAAHVHRIEIRLDRVVAAREEKPAITIRTDHPDQLTLTLGVLVLGKGAGSHETSSKRSRFHDH